MRLYRVVTVLFIEEGHKVKIVNINLTNQYYSQFFVNYLKKTFIFYTYM